MKKHKVVLSVLLFLLSTPLVIIIVVNNLSAEFFKSTLSKYVDENTNYIASIDGDFVFKISNKLSIKATDILVESKKQNANKESLSIKNIQISLSIFNLITGSYMPEHLKVKKLAAFVENTNNPNGKISPLAELFTKLKIQKSKITLAEMEHQQSGGSISIIIKDLKASPFGLKINTKIEADNYKSETPKISGNLGIDVSNIVPILELISDLYSVDIDIERASLQKADRRLKINTTFDTDETNGINFNEIKFDMLGINLSGSLQAKDISYEKARFNLAGSFNTNKINLIKLAHLAKIDYPLLFPFARLQTSVNGSEKNLKLNTTLDLFETKTKVQPSIKIQNQISRLDPFRGNFTIDALDILGFDSKARLNGDIRLYGKTLANIDFNANVKNLQRWLTLFNIENTSQFNYSTLKDLRFSGSSKLGDDHIELSQAKLSFDDTSVIVDLTATLKEKKDFEFAIIANQIDIDRYMPPKPKGPITPEGAAIGILHLPVELLNTLEGKGKIKIAEVKTSGIRVSEINIGLLANDGIIKAEPVEAKLLNGTYSSTLEINVKGSKPKISLDSKLQNLDLSKIEKPIDILGKLNFEGQAKAIGSDSEELLKSATGQARISLSSGALRYFNATGLIDTVQTIISCKCIQPLPKKGATVFEIAEASVLLKPSLNASIDLNLKGTNFLVRGDGYVDGEKDLSRYNLSLSFGKSSKAEAFKNVIIPINCKGSASKPKCRPNVQPLVKSVLKNQTTDKLKGIFNNKVKENIGKEAGEALKKIFNF